MTSDWTTMDKRDYEGTGLCRCCQRVVSMLSWTMIMNYSTFDSRFSCAECADILQILGNLEW